MKQVRNIASEIMASFPRKRQPSPHGPSTARAIVGALGRCSSASRFWVPAFAGMTIILTSIVGAAAQTVAGDQFADGANGAKVQVASGFVCPAKIGAFERDAVGETNPQTGADFCAYSALDGIYGTITLFPLQAPYDAKQSLADDFAEQLGTGGKKIGEGTVNIEVGGNSQPLEIYTRNYETAKLEELHYRVTYTGAAIGNWAVETTLEYADPRDTNEAQQFLRAAYAGAESGIVRPH
jgi:hypothetical protein